MSNEMDRRTLQALFAAVSNNVLSSEQNEKLQDALLNQPEARGQWFLWLDMEQGLQEWAATESEKKVNRVPFDSDGYDDSKLTRYRFLPRVGALAIAITLVIAVGIIFQMTRWNEQDKNQIATLPESAFNEVAVLTHTLDATMEGNNGILSGMPLGPSTIELTTGAIRIEFYRGASAILEAPCRLEIQSANKVFLKRGKFNVHVPPQAVGFTVETDWGQVIDLGTDFGLDLPETGSPELHVFNGRVRVNRESESLVLKTGQAVHLENMTSKIFVADRDQFQSESELIVASQQVANQRFQSWKKNSLALAQDKTTLFYLRFAESIEPGSGQQRRVRNSAIHPGSFDGSLVGGQRVSGRWPGKSGVLLQNAGDRIRFAVKQPLKEITLLAWVNVQSLPRWQNVLLSSDSENEGAIRWHLTKRGQLRLEIARDLGRPKTDWEAVESETFLTASRQRKWCMLVTTFDGKSIRHYADGQLIGAGESFMPPALVIDTAEIGNWLGRTRRNLHALIDEFAVLERVMTQEEIATLFEQGKP